MHLLDIICQGCIISMVAARVFHINVLLICVTLQCVVSFQPYHWPIQQQHVISCWVVNVNDTPNYNIKKILTLLDFSSLDGTVCYTESTRHIKFAWKEHIGLAQFLGQSFSNSSLVPPMYSRTYTHIDRSQFLDNHLCVTICTEKCTHI